jgi:PAS domain S-box-containing protein
MTIALVDAERAGTRQQFLGHAMALLSSSLDYNTTLISLANLAVPRIADWCTIDMLDDSGSISTLAVAHVDPAKVDYARRLQERFPPDPQGAHGVYHVMRTGESEMVRDIDEDLLEALVLDQEMLAIIRELGLCSSMTVPLKARGQMLGAITLVAAESGHSFDQDDLSLAEDLANRAALTIDNARLYRQAQRAAAEQTAVMERITDALVIVSMAEKITYMNNTARRYFGSGLAGQSVDQAAREIHTFTWDGRPHGPSDLPSRRALGGETITDLEWKVISPDGVEVYLQGSASPFEAQDGTRLGAVIAFRDVTERRRADEARGWLAAIVESSGDAIVGKTLDGIITSWNQGAERLYGYACNEVLGKPINLLVPPDRPDEIANILKRVTIGERVDHLETVRRRKDGQTIDVSLTVSPILDGTGRITGASAIARDVTASKRAQRVADRQAALLDLSQDAIFVRDFETNTIQTWNRGAQKLYGFSPPEAIGLISYELLETVLPVSMMEAKEQLVRTGHCELELTHTKRDGTHAVVMSRWALQWDDGRPAAILETNTDITGRKRADEELRRLSAELEQRVVERTIELESANNELESFAYSVSHDLRAPLRSMDGFSQVLVERYAEQFDAPGTRYLKHIRDASQEMGQLIDALLSLSRVTRSEMQRAPVDLSVLACSLEVQLRKTEPAREVTFEIADGLVTTGDAPLLRVMIDNLLGNAWKFSRPSSHARIEFGMTLERDIPIFFVRDNGAGFDMAYANKLFAPFQRLHTAGQFEGTGIGLATVQRIIRRHGGRIWAEGAVGEGSTFFFTLQPDGIGAI